MTTTTIRAALDAAVENLSAVSESPRLDAELLLARAIDVQRSYLFAHPDEELDEASVGRYLAALARRGAGEPMAYISGEKEFWSMTLTVSPATLVPRPETELLVEQALGFMPRRAALAVLDLGTGSGAIALALARERPLATIVATDASEDALDVARLNARNLAVANVEFLPGDWCAPVRGRVFDVVVTNPPYVQADDPALAVLAFEPRRALAAGPDGLDAIRRIAAEVPGIIRTGGHVLLEHGATQEEAVARLLESAGFAGVHCRTDLAGHARVSIATWQR